MPLYRQNITLRNTYNLPGLFRSISGESHPNGARQYSRSLLKWAVVGASGTAFAISVAPHSPARWLRHFATQPRDEKPESSETPSTIFQFPKNIKNLIILDGNDEQGTSIDGGTKDAKKQSWGGLAFLQSSFSLDEISSTLSSWVWPASFASLKEKSSALLLELSRGPGSLFSQIVHDPPDLSVHPECQWDAEVRLGDSLCLSERAFLRERKRKMKATFARLLDVAEDEIDERDLPVVAMAGSGGGFRAMINTTGSLVGASSSGLLDCVTYTAGISGSCWALGVLYSGVAGSTTPEAAAKHLTERIQKSYLDMSTLDMLITPPTNKYLLYGLLRKAISPLGNVSLVDLYGTLLSARLLVPDDLGKLDSRFLSLHHFRHNIDNGAMPMPIFTAVRHEIPIGLEEPLAEAQGEQKRSVDSNRRELFRREEEDIEDLSSWLWFEFTPFEVGCDELGAWIPSWSLGRRFQGGKSVERTPEISFSILSGIYGSAFCASLQHYFAEVQPIIRQLPTQLYEWLDDIITENNEDFDLTHPVAPDEFPNFVKGLHGQLRKNSPPDITERDTLGFMDAGAELNIPYYPLFRRDVDCIIALDASADSQDLWFTRAEQYAARRGLSTWPKGARWPTPLRPPGKEIEAPTAPASPSPSSESPSDAVNRTLAEAQEKEASGQAKKITESDDREVAGSDEGGTRSSHDEQSRNNLPGGNTDGSSAVLGSTPKPMSTCTIWMGSSAGSQESSRLDDLEEQDLMRRDGIAIVYNPLIPNDAVPDFDPMSVSTWSLSVEKEETEKLLRVAEANFVEGQEKLVKLLRAIWLRKKAKREAKEDQHSNRRKRDFES